MSPDCAILHEAFSELAKLEGTISKCCEIEGIICRSGRINEISLLGSSFLPPTERSFDILEYRIEHEKKIEFEELKKLRERLHKMRLLREEYIKLTHVTESIGKRTELTSICLMGNALETLSAEICHMPKLEPATWNKLTVIPGNIDNLTKLKSLGLLGNLLETLPGGMVNLKSLEKVFLLENPGLHPALNFDSLDKQNTLGLLNVIDWENPNDGWTLFDPYQMQGVWSIHDVDWQRWTQNPQKYPLIPLILVAKAA